MECPIQNIFFNLNSQQTVAGSWPLHQQSPKVFVCLFVLVFLMDFHHTKCVRAPQIKFESGRCKNITKWQKINIVLQFSLGKLSNAKSHVLFEFTCRGRGTGCVPILLNIVFQSCDSTPGKLPWERTEGGQKRFVIGYTDCHDSFLRFAPISA